MPDRETDGDSPVESADDAAPNDDITMAEVLTGTGSRTDGCSLLVVHQRRRVNPESLALRLGPDLVRDLDALITPGNTEMPSFAVRKELQERYSIDRRHIYDYFHSRGLRVVKEDKHGNPVPAANLKDLQVPTPLVIIPRLYARSPSYVLVGSLIFALCDRRLLRILAHTLRTL